MYNWDINRAWEKHIRLGIKVINSTMKSIQAYATTKFILNDTLILSVLVLLKLEHRKKFNCYYKKDKYVYTK